MIQRQLETNRLVIRRINMADGESIHRYMTRPDLVRFLPEEVLSLDNVKVATAKEWRWVNENVYTILREGFLTG